MRKTIDHKFLSIKMPTETWKFLKIQAVHNNEFPSEIALRCIEKYRKKVEAKAELIAETKEILTKE